MYQQAEKTEKTGGWFSFWSLFTPSAPEDMQAGRYSTYAESDLSTIVSQSAAVLPTVGLLLMYAQLKTSFYQYKLDSRLIAPSYVMHLGTINPRTKFIDLLDQAIDAGLAAYQPAASATESADSPSAICSTDSFSFSSQHGPTGKQRAKDFKYTYDSRFSPQEKLELVIKFLVCGAGNHRPGSLKTQLKQAIVTTFSFNSIAVQRCLVDSTEVARTLIQLRLNHAPELCNEEEAQTESLSSNSGADNGI